MKTDTDQKIIAFIGANYQVSVQDLIRHLSLSPQAIHRQLKKLVAKDLIRKIGSPPKVFYELSPTKLVDTERVASSPQEKLVEDHFVIVLPSGEELTGTKAFTYWCGQRGFNYFEYVSKYGQVWDKYNQYRNPKGLIDATRKIQSTYHGRVFVDKLFYLDFSAWEVFGKTKTYTYLLYSKLNQDLKLMIQLFNQLDLKKVIEKFCQAYNIEAIGFIPPTVPRKIQFQKELERFLYLPLPKIEIIKVKTPILTPQKTLSTTEDRIENSKSTFVIRGQLNFQNVLLIDDFAGSGATLNFVAEKIKARSPQINIQALALCGSPNGVVDNSKKFEVIKEV